MSLSICPRKKKVLLLPDGRRPARWTQQRCVAQRRRHTRQSLAGEYQHMQPLPRRGCRPRLAWTWCGVVARRYYYGTDGGATFFFQFSSDEQAKKPWASCTIDQSVQQHLWPHASPHQIRDLIAYCACGCALRKLLLLVPGRAGAQEEKTHTRPAGEQKALPPYYASRVVINWPSPLALHRDRGTCGTLLAIGVHSGRSIRPRRSPKRFYCLNFEPARSV